MNTSTVLLTAHSWDHVDQLLRFYPPRTSLLFHKGGLQHPKAAGFYSSVGVPEGQFADFRRVRPDGSGLHIKDFQNHYAAHRDEVDPSKDVVEHARRDAPVYYVGGAAILTAVSIRLLGGNWKVALGFATIAALAAHGALPKT